MKHHIAAHTMTVAGFGFAVWSVGNLTLATAGMIACLVGIGWFIAAQCKEGTP